jgi:hypothetical protein
MMHSPNWLEEPEKLNISFYKDEIIQEVFRKQPLDSNSYSLYPAQKKFPTNQNVQQDHVISMEMKEMNFHASGRFIVNNDKGNFVALRLIIKKKTFVGNPFNILTINWICRQMR